MSLNISIGTLTSEYNEKPLMDHPDIDWQKLIPLSSKSTDHYVFKPKNSPNNLVVNQLIDVSQNQFIIVAYDNLASIKKRGKPRLIYTRHESNRFPLKYLIPDEANKKVDAIAYIDMNEDKQKDILLRFRDGAIYMIPVFEIER
ncbi:hypothetical protein BVY03_03975 [bacterium K02(2017)]|nr:hypothetical protein BVY03_03975 [bacterium K02(2017)]